jgi:hypothetical protein
MTMYLLRHLKRNTVAYFALFVALGGTSYASITIHQNALTTNSARSAKSSITCGGSCPASKVYWAYIGAHGIINLPINVNTGQLAAPSQPAVYATALGGIPAQVLHLGVGDFMVYFQQQDLSNCARFANLTHDRGSATISGYDHTDADPQGIHVMTTDANGNPADLDFVVLALCGKAPLIQFGAAPPAAGVGGK